MATFVPLLAIPIQLQDSTTSVNMASGSLEFFLAGTSTPTNMFSDNAGTSIGTSITLNSGGYPESGGNVITLFIDSSISYKIVGKDAAAATVFTSDNIGSSLSILASVSNAKGASLIGVEDSGAFFAAAEVEAILADIGGNYLKKDVAKTITAVYTFGSGGALALADFQIRRAELLDYGITHNAVSSSSGTVVLDLETGNSFVTTLTENITTVTLSNPPATGTYGQLVWKIIQDGSAGAFTVAFPASVLWPSGTAPTITVTNDAIDEVTLRTIDAGTQWRGSFSQAFS